MGRVLRVVVILAVIAVSSVGFVRWQGGSQEVGSEKVDRTIDLDMVELAFQPAEVSVKAGETIRFRFHNRGKLPHDAFIGDEQEQAQHAQLMLEEGMEHAHSIEPGKTSELVRTFAAPGSTVIGCQQPGHYPAGMKMTVNVTA